MILFGVEILDRVTGKSAYFSLHQQEKDAKAACKEYLAHCPLAVRAVIKKRNWSTAELEQLAYQWGWSDALYSCPVNDGLPPCMISPYQQGYRAFLEKN